VEARESNVWEVRSGDNYYIIKGGLAWPIPCLRY
jgi:hypothetical protein